MAHIELREAVDKYFSLGELRMLCFDLDIDYENLEGDSKSAKIISLILFCQRRHRLPELLNEVQKLRPDQKRHAMWLCLRRLSSAPPTSVLTRPQPLIRRQAGSMVPASLRGCHASMRFECYHGPTHGK